MLIISTKYAIVYWNNAKSNKFSENNNDSKIVRVHNVEDTVTNWVAKAHLYNSMQA